MYCSELPAASDAFCGVIPIEESVIGAGPLEVIVSPVELVILPTTALIVTLPVACAVASPPLLIDAVAGLLDDQVAEEITFCMDPSV